MLCDSIGIYVSSKTGFNCLEMKSLIIQCWGWIGWKELHGRWILPEIKITHDIYLTSFFIICHGGFNEFWNIEQDRGNDDWYQIFGNSNILILNQSCVTILLRGENISVCTIERLLFLPLVCKQPNISQQLYSLSWKLKRTN